MLEESNRRDAILASAAELFAENGVSATTVRAIGSKVGLLSGSLYHHFRSKDEMVQEILLNYIHELLERYADLADTSRTPKDAFAALVRESMATVECHPHATQIYLNDSAYVQTLPESQTIRALASRVPEYWIDIIDRGVAVGEFRDDVPSRVIYHMVRESLWRSVMWFEPTPEYGREELARDLLSIYLVGFGGDRS